MIKGTIQSIGAHAVDEQEPMLIFFGEEAAAELRKVSIIQSLPQKEAVLLKEGSQISFDDSVYKVQRVGKFVNENMQAIAHITMIFAAVPQEDQVENAVYLTPYVLPQIKKGMVISYEC